MRVILDTNVLLAALISPGGVPDQIYRAWRGRRFDLITAREQLNELHRVSRYPKLKEILPPHRIGTMINNLNSAVILDRLPDLPDGVDLADPDDRFLLRMVLAGDADFLVTGDKKAGLLQFGSYGRAQILTPVTFAELMR
jgi:uncharacterized protein